MLKEAENLIRTVSSTTTRLGLSFLELYGSTCEVSTSARLKCACPNYEDKFMKNLIVPFSRNGKKLLFDNFVHRVIDQGNQGKFTESCFFEESKVFYLLSIECCVRLIDGSDDSVDYCPHMVVANYPSVVLDGEITIVEGGNVQGIDTKCDSTTVSQLWPGDLMKLSTCDISMVDKVGNYFLKGSGLFDVQVKMNQILTAEETLGSRDVIFYSIVAIAGFLLLLLLFASVLFCSQKAREKIFNCCCNNCERGPNYLEPLGNRSADGAREYELRALHIRPFVSSGK
jgi:hypothetical protein